MAKYIIAPFTGILASIVLLAGCSADIETDKRVDNEKAVKQLFTEHSDLLDPFSVNLRGLSREIQKRQGGGTVTTWCGQLNAKNGLGAYMGWQDFVVAQPKGEKPLISIVGAGDSDAFYEALCEDAQEKPAETSHEYDWKELSPEELELKLEQEINEAWES